MGLDLNTALISDTFDGLIKTQDGNILTDSPLPIGDGRGNDSSLSLATAGNGVTITGTLLVDGANIGTGLSTAQADITAIKAKTDFITITGAVNLDTIKTKIDFISVTQAVDLDTIESDVLSAKTKTDFISVTQAVDLDTMESDILSAKTKTDFISVSQAVNLDTIESDIADAQSDIIDIETKTDFITITQAVNLDSVESDASAAKTKTDFLTVTQAVDLDTLESDVNVAKGDITAIETKTDFISVSQAVNLDTIESDVADAKTKTDFITITQAVDLDDLESDVAQAQTDINLIEGKTDFISVTQAVNLDTMESNIATNNAKNSYPAGDAAKVGFISVTQAVDLDSMETDISNLSSNKYDKTGGTISGDVVVTGDLTVNGTTTTINTQTLSVEDPLIELANQNSSNTVDTGFYANYSLDAGVTTKYAGLFKDASDSDKFKLFKGLEVEPTSSVNTGGTGYAKADLVVADLDATSANISGNLAVDTNTLYVDAANNRVGINTLSPDESLELYSNEASVLIANSSGNVNSTSSVKFSNGSTVEPKAAIFFEDTLSNNRGVLHLAVNSNTLGTPVSLSDAKLTIDNSGNVGIGESSPSSSAVASGAVIVDLKGNAVNRGGVVNFRTSDSSKIAWVGFDGGLAKFGTETSNDAVFYTANTERMRIDSSGNVGIGTQSPNKLSFLETQLAVEGSGDSGVHIVGNRASGGLGLGYLTFINNGSSVTSFNKRIATIVSSTDSNAESGNLQFSTANSSGTLSEAMRIDSSGRVSINDAVSGSVATNYNPELLVGGNIVARSLTANAALIEIGGDATSAFITAGKQDGSQTARAIRFEVGTSEAMRITSGGNVLIGTQGIPNGTSVYGAAFEPSTADRSELNFGTSSTADLYAIRFFNPNGEVGSIRTSGSSTSYNTSSDYRLKENVVEMTGALDRVDALKPSRFNFIADPEKTVDGFLAHEVAEVIPEAISGEKDAVDEEGNPIYQGIDQSKIVPLLVGAIKELSAKVAALESQLNA